MEKVCTIIGTVVAKPETREELLAILTAQVAPTRAEPGCINYDFHADADDPCTFVFYENWRSKADLDDHLKMPHLKPLFDRQEALLACPVEIRFLDMLSDWAN
ncbi:putative quinol monooxygenase [Bauldia litoralis]|uniref:Quinol monooxygenase YgiN n=1 Tax=Bauldia litoralis TaxID=665467 RepID=A0A1G6CBB5_9HYPH|nr:putative quinol monooxygenase [Bauldia litoralis]SDB30114.1 Quinol monooxygenase YgiN [Bauldia litoralis]